MINYHICYNSGGLLSQGINIHALSISLALTEALNKGIKEGDIVYIQKKE